VDGYFPQWKWARVKKGDSRWDGSRSTAQSVSLFYIRLNALPNPLSPPIDEKGKRPARALTALSLLLCLGLHP